MWDECLLFPENYELELVGPEGVFSSEISLLRIPEGATICIRVKLKERGRLKKENIKGLLLHSDCLGSGWAFHPFQNCGDRVYEMQLCPKSPGAFRFAVETDNGLFGARYLPQAVC